ncbi:MAG: hypothetical protein LC789_02920 [Actinobacteria bacterium]|nr:hypothetical protein [Actinomycetota bacterium]
MTGSRTRGDDGASLVLALVFLTLFAFVVAALLSFGSASFRATATVKADGGAVYTADGALDTAVNQVRQSSYNNTSSQTCPTVNYPDANGTGASTVTCDGGPGTGGSSGSSVLITAANKPGSAIYTTSTTEAGMVQGSNNDIVVHGRVFSNSAVTVSTASHLKVDNAPLYARGLCDAGASGTAVPGEAGTQCGLGSGTPTTPGGISAAVRPSYSPPSFSATFDPNGATWRQSVPTSCPANGLVSLNPGIYDDAVALTTLTSTACVVLFRPGVYYFNFRTSDTWTINNASATVVGGTPPTAAQATTPPEPPQVAWDPAASPPVVTIPGSCRNPRLDQNNGGVQFLFGGSSHVSVLAGRMELCGRYSSTSPPLVVFGLESGTATSVTASTMTPSGAGSATVTTGSTAFSGGLSALTCTSGTPLATYRNVVCPDDATSTASFANSNNQSATLTMQGFTPTTAIPPGSTLNSATLTVRHGEKDSQCNGSSGLGVSVVLTPSGGAATAPITVPLRCSAAGTLGNDAVTVTSELAAAVEASGWSGGTIGYTVTGKNNSAALDNVKLDMTYTPFQYIAQSGCVTAEPYTGGSSPCALVKAFGAQTRLYIEGTTYVPKAAIDVALTNVGAQVFNFGIVARTLWVTLTASSGFALPVIQIPDDDNGPAPLTVYFTVWQCLTTSPCGQVHCRLDPSGRRPGPGRLRVSVSPAGALSTRAER